MAESGSTQFLIYFALFIGFVGVILAPSVNLGLGLKLTPGQFSTQVFIPTTISLLFLFAGYVGLSLIDYDELTLQYMLITSSIGATLFACLSMILSWNRIRFAAF
jgi:hypothetical protein